MIEAEPFFREAAKLAPDLVDVQLDLGQFLMSRIESETGGSTFKADLREAREVFRRCLDLDPNRPESLLHLGLTYLVPGENPGVARKYIDKAYRLLPSSRQIVFAKVEAHLAAGEEDSAIAILQATLAARAEGGLGESVSSTIESMKKRRAEAKARLSAESSPTESPAANPSNP